MKELLRWIKGEVHIHFKGNEEDFKKWIKEWYADVPGCSDFICCHELMSCGIGLACGGCSSYNTMVNGTGGICDNVNCIDCLIRYKCVHGYLSLEELEGMELKFIDKGGE